MVSRKTTIHYNREQDQWCVKLNERMYPLHCGESFLLHIGKTTFSCQLELDANWYVIVQETPFVLHPTTIYSVSM
ncbi:hypothetical protein DesyoDRAFT_3156 [Desulfosporosinus youngiae DSM 17734]|uniref:DUF5348 domain-containing protein n=1 Tax=Desulfosporosinus youngiae DSM 17734 TaxID=768710 RepID=H5XTY3_9FIRM|nr:hypothetical protein DesyoDRAFT_1816 [Desulfosporosinus youngiae DSM 17734]EHQ89564.1 hypothetical protein DesyoDRAFT_2491 [Desulfosporosinus youngiae DSM 17734]EHQ90190.1 hypothetical protein DesyoDRAFT_3156 [Desulfosporosinus youngiae DSM 17734]